MVRVFPVGENDPARLPSDGGSSCNRCDIDPAEILPRSEPEPTPADPPDPPAGGGGGGPNSIE